MTVHRRRKKTGRGLGPPRVSFLLPNGWRQQASEKWGRAGEERKTFTSRWEEIVSEFQCHWEELREHGNRTGLAALRVTKSDYKDHKKPCSVQNSKYKEIEEEEDDSFKAKNAACLAEYDRKRRKRKITETVAKLMRRKRKITAPAD